jgi:hypothetical protein
LLEASCDTTLACDTGLTGWELAADLRRAEVVAMQPVAEHQVTPPHAAGDGTCGRRGAEEKKRHKDKRGRKTAAAASGDAPLLPLADSDARRFML